ncbi:hypothetical protein L207DRAFT_485465 [Hyaloscypha variabilis F]|uniref:DUF676 domain-containing protein n=1 Tax=Hyaloscypha variabilis (strain UAMH 11265 / GT02V1 / F) TaxID=1149755 RepID=A0A2J6RU38_HYAVF|nr:hypothetical protein L207DRAFT_485465 [Hyaloscypha variabilis F]
MVHQTKFYGSQVGGSVVIPHSYTGSPLQLLRQDVASAFGFWKFLPFIVYPFRPQFSGPLCELYPSASNLWSMFLHLILFLLQLPFVLSIPIWIFFPLWSILGGVAVFWLVNSAIWYLLNGKEIRFPSNPKFAEKKPKHEHEQWIFLNGVAVGCHWLQSNVDRLALTFGRPVIGVHNKTNGIIFDVLQCLIQRNFNYATQDIRDCYSIVKSTLYDPNLTKVVFILHSQGGIEGGMIIDWLLQEVPQDLLAKLEVYTFGNAANHFNNPHLHLLSQHAALSHPLTPSTTSTSTSIHYHTPLPSLPTTNPRTSSSTSTSGKTIHHIEHYAHTSDFVSRWGVLHFTCNFSLSPTAPRFMGRVFERVGEGHQFNMHYLDSMFPLEPAPPEREKGGIGGSGFSGAKTENEFMESMIVIGKEGDEASDEREGVEVSYLGAHGMPLGLSSNGNGVGKGEKNGVRNGVEEVIARTEEDVGFGDLGEMKERKGGTMQVKVKDLSRLWLYINGGSPKLDEVDVGIARMATM